MRARSIPFLCQAGDVVEAGERYHHHTCDLAHSAITASPRPSAKRLHEPLGVLTSMAELATRPRTDLQYDQSNASMGARSSMTRAIEEAAEQQTDHEYSDNAQETSSARRSTVTPSWLTYMISSCRAT